MSIKLDDKEIQKAFKKAEKQWWANLAFASWRHLTTDGGFQRRIAQRQSEWKPLSKSYKRSIKTKRIWDRSGKTLTALNTTLKKAGSSKGLKMAIKNSRNTVYAYLSVTTFGKHLKKKPNTKMKQRIMSLNDFKRPLFRYDRPDVAIMEKNLSEAIEENFKKVGL